MIAVDYQHGFLSVSIRGITRDDVGPALIVESIRRSITRNESDRLILLVNDHNKATSRFELDTVDLYSNTSLLQVFCRNHVLYPLWIENEMRDFLIQCYQERVQSDSIIYSHDKLGWYLYNDRLSFLYDITDVDGHLSTYNDSSFPFRSGSADVYAQFLSDVVWPCPTLSLAMAIGLASVVNARMTMSNLVDTGTIIVNLCGASSTGKTTAEELIVSAFARPNPAPGSRTYPFLQRNDERVVYRHGGYSRFADSA